MGKMKQMSQDIIDKHIHYLQSDVIDLFGSDLEMFGELIVGTPNCEFCWHEDGSDNPASYCWSVPEMRDDPTARERDAVLFTCVHCEEEDV